MRYLKKTVGRALAVFVLISIVASFVSGVSSARYILSSAELKDVYYQNEKLEIITVILNNDSTLLELRNLNIIVESAKIIGKNSTIFVNITVPINVSLERNESFTIYYKLSLRSLVPDKYNLTVFLELRYFAEPIKKVTVIKDWKFQVKPYVEIPPAAIIILLIMIGVIIVFIGYGIAGRIGRKKR